jgi:hypothetical protein
LPVGPIIRAAISSLLGLSFFKSRVVILLPLAAMIVLAFWVMTNASFKPILVLEASIVSVMVWLIGSRNS